MPGLARVVAPGLPYHVTHRGNRRQDVFFRPEDREVYKDWLSDYAQRYELAVWAYCLMTNHVHLIVSGGRSNSLARTMGCTHGLFARRQNRLHKWSGHLWANRFFSTPLDEEHLWTAVRYVEMNPVRAGLASNPCDYRWSSARAHAGYVADPLLSAERPFPGRVEDWQAWLTGYGDSEGIDVIRRNTSTGRPSGSPEFVSYLEARLERTLTPEKRGPRPRN